MDLQAKLVDYEERLGQEQHRNKLLNLRMADHMKLQRERRQRQSGR